MHITSLKSIGLVAVVAVSAALMPGKSANATNGFLGICTGAKNCGMAGAGIALPQDASSGNVNPALMGRVKDQIFVSPGWFHPVPVPWTEPMPRTIRVSCRHRSRWTSKA